MKIQASWVADFNGFCRYLTTLLLVSARMRPEEK